jgi:hypothetical protein
VASDFFERVARGEQPSINDYCERYAQIADLIRETFAAVSFIEESLSDHPIDSPH